MLINNLSNHKKKYEVDKNAHSYTSINKKSMKGQYDRDFFRRQINPTLCKTQSRWKRNEQTPVKNQRKIFMKTHHTDFKPHLKDAQLSEYYEKNNGKTTSSVDNLTKKQTLFNDEKQAIKKLNFFQPTSAQRDHIQNNYFKTNHSQIKYLPSRQPIKDQQFFGTAKNIKVSQLKKKKMNNEYYLTKFQHKKANTPNYAQISTSNLFEGFVTNKKFQETLQKNSNQNDSKYEKQSNVQNRSSVQKYSTQRQSTQEQINYLQKLRFNQVFFCLDCLRYIFAIQKHFHFPSCQKPLEIDHLSNEQKRKIGFQRIAMIVQLSKYANTKIQQISNVQQLMKKNKYTLRKIDIQNR